MWTQCEKSFAPLCPVAFSSEWGSVFQSHLLTFPSLQPKGMGEQELRGGEASVQLGKGVMTLHTRRSHGHASGSVYFVVFGHVRGCRHVLRKDS